MKIKKKKRKNTQSWEVGWIKRQGSEGRHGKSEVGGVDISKIHYIKLSKNQSNII